jgi:hypothetical protein
VASEFVFYALQLLILLVFLTMRISKLYSKNEKYTYVVQDDCNLVKKDAGEVAGSIGVSIKKGEKGYGHCKLVWGKGGRGFMFAKGRPRAVWRSEVVGNFLWAKNNGELVAAKADGSTVGSVIHK